MEPVLNLHFSEWTVINELEQLFSKTEGYTVSIPSSRQQKGFDIILYNNFSKKSLTIQVKGSRTYSPKPPKRLKTVRFKNYTWFNAFNAIKGNSDYYILFGLYVKAPSKDSKSTRMNNRNWFDFVLLLFTEDEMIKFLSELTLKNSEDKDSKFGFGFDDTKQIFLTRGAKEKIDYTDKLFKKRFTDLKKLLNPDNKKYETKKRQAKNETKIL